MDDLTAFALEALLGMELIPAELVGAAVLSMLGLKLYSATRQPTDNWDQLLKQVGLALMVLAALGLIAVVVQLN